MQINLFKLDQSLRGMKTTTTHRILPYFFFIISCFICVNASYAQIEPTNWSWQNPVPSGNQLFKMSLPTANTGYAVGTGGTILKTTDNCNNWTLINQQQNIFYQGIAFKDANTGVVCGTTIGTNASVLKRTTNGGDSWTDCNITFQNVPDDIFCVEDSIFYVIAYNGTTAKSTNSGLTWNFVTPIGIASLSAYFLNSDTGFVGGRSGIRKTTNGGINWTNMGPTLLPFDGIFSLKAYDISNIVMVSERGMFYKTTNGGIDWLTINLDFPTSSSGSGDLIRSLDFTPDGTKGYVVSSLGRIAKTTDSGNTWIIDSSYNITTWWYVKCRGESEIIIAGAGGSISRSTNSGSTWQSVAGVDTPYRIDIEEVQFMDDNLGYYCGSKGTVYKTTDGGDTRMRLNTGINYNLYGIYFLNPNTGWAVGDTGVIIKTTDGGNNWIQQSFGQVRELNAVHFTDINNGYAAGNRSLVKTTNGGQNWIIIPGQTSIYESAYFKNANTGFIGSEAIVKMTTNGGTSWIGVASGGYDISFVNDTLGFSCGYEKVSRTTNGGLNWTTYTFPAPYAGQNMTSIHFVNTNTGYTLGQEGQVFKSTDSGLNWNLLPSIIGYSGNNATNAMYFTGVDKGTVVGRYGMITKMNNPLISVINNTNEIPDNFILYQNYPNPFNPSTVINYSIPKLSMVKLTVYDMTGRIVKVIENGYKQAGNYSAIFNAGNLSSGIYFYTLTSESSKKTKKMLLLK